MAWCLVLKRNTGTTLALPYLYLTKNFEQNAFINTEMIDIVKSQLTEGELRHG